MCPKKDQEQEPLLSASEETISTTTTSPRILYKKLFLLPVFVAVASPLVTITTYTIAVQNGHVAPVFPCISETGSLPPESCIFSQLLNVASIFVLLIVYVKYHQVRLFAKLRPSRATQLRSNAVAAGFGAASCIGLSIVANFQEAHMLTVHLIGASIYFHCSTIYFLMQTKYSRHMSPEINSSATVYVRQVLSALCFFFTFTMMVSAAISCEQFQRDLHSGHDRRHWGPEDGGYVAHLISTISEWLLMLCFTSFVLSFTTELTNVHVYSPEFILLNVEPEKSGADK